MDRSALHGQMTSEIDLRGVPHSAHDLGNHNFLTGKLGKLIPTRVDEIYPGDRIKGAVKIVANFEPLAAPIMSSMVCKQETFYIPYSILWRNSHKFFTGKQGFEGDMPSISPVAIFNAYVNFGLVPSFSSIINAISEFVEYSRASSPSISDVLVSHEVIRNIFDSLVSSIDTFGNRYGVVDLLYPVRQRYYDLIHSVDGIDKYYAIIAGAVEQLNPNVTLDMLRDYIQPIIETLIFAFEYFFGLSSLCDYVGWPTFDSWRTYFNTILDYFTVDSVNDPNEPIDYSLIFSRISLNFMPFRAYYVVWYWNYRDQLLETSAIDPETDEFMSDVVSDIQAVLCTLLRVRCWYKDLFTTALTNTGSANLVVPSIVPNDDSAIEVIYYDKEGNKLSNTSDASDAINAGATICRISFSNYEYDVPVNYLSTAMRNSAGGGNAGYPLTGFSIDVFDRIRRLRTFLQKKLVNGYEYDDVIWASFLVKLSNVRMRIPELLSRGRDEVAINTLVNNTTTAEQAAGDKTAVAWSQGSSSGINYFAEEHGLLIHLMTILPIQSYTGGMSRLYLKKSPFDFMWPEFATLGMDAIYNCELSAPRGSESRFGLTDSHALQVFGYQGRYYDLKSKIDEEHGRLRSDLNFLTFSREFNNIELPKLNYIFVHCWPRTDMFVVDDGSEDLFRADISHEFDFERRLPAASEYIGY